MANIRGGASSALDLALTGIPLAIETDEPSRRLVLGGGSCYCRLVAQAGAKPRALDILSTEFYRYDPDTPYRMALPLATELAQARSIARPRG